MSQPQLAVLAMLSVAYFLCYIARMMLPSALPFIASEFRLSPQSMGAALSAFFLGYALMQIPGGLLADRLGPRLVLTATIVAWSAFSALTSAATSVSGLLVARVLFGLSEGAFPAAASKALALYFPERQLGRANGVMLACTQLGASAAPVTVALLVTHWGWRIAFCSLILPGVVVAAGLGGALARQSNSCAARSQSGDNKLSHLSFASLLDIIPSVRWCALSTFFGNLAAWGLLNWLPLYLLQARGFSVKQMGLYASIPSLAAALGYFIGGQVSDRYFADSRRTLIVCGLMLSSCATFAAARANRDLAVALLTIAFFFLFIADGGLCTLPLVLVPQEKIGQTFGLMNTAAQVASFLSPILAGQILSATSNNFLVLFNSLVVMLVAAAVAAAKVIQGDTAAASSRR